MQSEAPITFILSPLRAGMRLARMVGMARCAVPARVLAGGTNNRAELAFEGVAPLLGRGPSARWPLLRTQYPAQDETQSRPAAGRYSSLRCDNCFAAIPALAPSLQVQPQTRINYCAKPCRFGLSRRRPSSPAAPRLPPPG